MNPSLQGFQTTLSSETIQRRAARNPATNPAELQRLFAQRLNEGNHALKEALAYNPSMPLALLGQLVEEAPSAFCRNPITPLIPLEMPDFLEKVSSLGIARMLRSPRAPASLVHQIAEGTGFLDYLTQTARWHIQYREPIPDAEWASSVRQLLWEWVRALPSDVAKQAVVELAELDVIPQAMTEAAGDWPVEGVQDYAAFCSCLTPEQLAKTEQGYHNIPEKPFTYEEFENEEDQYIYLGASFNPAVSDETLMEWRGSVYELIKTLARNPQASAQTLLQFSLAGDIDTRRTVLRNPSCPPEAVSRCRGAVLMRILRETPDSYFQYAANSYWKPSPPWAFGRVVALLKAPEPVRRPLFRRYATSPMWEDRLAAALSINDRPNGQPMKPKHRVMLEQLASDGNCLVRATAQGRLRGETFSIEE